MDEKKLLEFIDANYEWTYPFVSNDEAKFERLKPSKTTVKYKTLETNPQLGPRIIGMKPTCGLKPCDWCGRVVNQRCSHTLRLTSIDGKRPKRRWEHNCQTCNKMYDAKTGELRSKNARKPRDTAPKEAKPPAKKIYWWNENLPAKNKPE